MTHRLSQARPNNKMLDVRGPPRTVQKVHRDRPRLYVRPDAHLLGRADQHRDVPGAGSREQPGFLGVVLGFVDVADLMPWDAAGGELLAQLVIGVPTVAGCAEVAEDDL